MIYIITHKEFEKPEARGYKSVLVGAYKGHLFGDLYDDLGDNISEKNENYCELTGIYWIWKHIKDEYIGIVHYRRYFSHSIHFGDIVSEDVVKKILERYDIILPFHSRLKKTVQEHFCEESGLYKDLSRVREIIKKKYPEYLDTYDYFMLGKRICFFNMMICKNQLFSDYCEWLFDILFELEKEIDYSEYNDYQKRIYGFLSERLLNVYVLKNNIKVFEMGVINTEEKWSLKKRIMTGLKRWLLYYLQ